MTDWAIRIPVRDPGELVEVKTAFELSDLLDGDDREITRELLVFVKTCLPPGRHVAIGTLAELIETLDRDERTLLLNLCRRKAGLPTTKQIEDHRRWQAADQAGRLRMREQGPTLQGCHADGCQAIPIDPAIGQITPVDVPRWFCPEHIDQAQPGDMEPPRLELRISPTGTYEPIDAVEEARDAAHAATDAARRELEREQRMRERQAEPRPADPPIAANLRAG